MQLHVIKNKNFFTAVLFTEFYFERAMQLQPRRNIFLSIPWTQSLKPGYRSRWDATAFGISSRYAMITVNSEIFARILFSRIALKDIFATLKIRDWGILYLY